MSVRSSLRTHSCGELRRTDVDESREITLAGWVHSLRDHGGVIFVDLRDRYGLTQIVFRPEDDVELHRSAEGLRQEDVIQVVGRVEARPEGTVNPALPTGEVEVRVGKLEVLNRSETPPFEVSMSGSVSQDVRLKYRYLEMRNPEVARRFEFRHRLATALRSALDGDGFLEVETPFLTKSTPEGARDYLVPSRVSPGSFYALPQSPQIFKQILMISGMDRYFQFVRCFRDEDLRADRQPEFTQLDIEMSFVEEGDVQATVERALAAAVSQILGVEVPIPFPRIPYPQAMAEYGTDCPDLRFELRIREITDLAGASPFQIFRKVVEGGGKVRGIRVPQGGSLTRKQVEELEPIVREAGAKGLAWAKVREEGLVGPIARHFAGEAADRLCDRLEAVPGDLLVFVADQEDVVCRALGVLRGALARRLDLVPGDSYRFAWVTEFPLFEKGSEGGITSCHHPFTAPVAEDLPFLGERPLEVRARAYDLVLNGSEVGGGSIRIHTRPVQGRVFAALGISEETAEQKFGFLLEALTYGAPPHGGIALGFDRLVTQCLGLSSIREVVAFPKTTTAACPLTGAPAPVEESQLRELGLSRNDPAEG